MEEKNAISLKERLSMDLKRFGAPYNGKEIQNSGTEKQLNDELISILKCFEQDPVPNNTEESYADTDLFL